MTVNMEGTSSQIHFRNTDNYTVVLTGPGTLKIIILRLLERLRVASLDNGLPMNEEPNVTYIEFVFYFGPERTIIARFLPVPTKSIFEIQLALDNVMQDNRCDTILWESGAVVNTDIEVLTPNHCCSFL
jgi:hypothetical protein